MRKHWNPGIALLVVAAVGGLFVTAAGAETSVAISGEVRARSEVDSRSFDPDAALRQYTDLRTRVVIDALTDANVRAFVQIQDSRRLGSLTGDGAPASGLLNDGRNVDLHQAYLQVSRLWEGGPGFQAGRFEVNLGNQRVFGAVGWHNIGRSWEGLKVSQDFASVRASAYWLKRLELNDPSENRDFDVYGIYSTIPSANLDLFAFLEHDAAAVPGAADVDANLLDRVDLGLYYTRQSGPVDITVNGVYQIGTTYAMVATTPLEQDIAAFLITGELGYRFSGEGKARLAAGFDLASRDDDGTDDSYKAYDNLYYTGHKFRGAMDYFLASNVQGLMDLMVRGSIQMTPGWTLKGDLHHFSTAQDYMDLDGDETKSVGIEMDLAVSTTRVPGVKIDGGASLFIPSDSFAGYTDHESGLWFYGMMTAAFGGK